MLGEGQRKYDLGSSFRISISVLFIDHGLAVSIDLWRHCIAGITLLLEQLIIGDSSGEVLLLQPMDSCTLEVLGDHTV